MLLSRALSSRLYLRVVDVSATINEHELAELALKLRGLRPSVREATGADRITIRKAVAVLTQRQPPASLIDLEALDHTHDQTLGPILLCATLDLSLPLSLLERFLGQAIDNELQPWLLFLKKHKGTFVVLEDSSEAQRLADKKTLFAQVATDFQLC